MNLTFTNISLHQGKIYIHTGGEGGGGICAFSNPLPRPTAPADNITRNGHIVKLLLQSVISNTLNDSVNAKQGRVLA